MLLALSKLINSSKWIDAGQLDFNANNLALYSLYRILLSALIAFFYNILFILYVTPLVC
jgi:hypothetical protein